MLLRQQRERTTASTIMSSVRKLQLVAWKHRFAVCKLPAGAPLPPWIATHVNNDHASSTDSDNILSITRTADELSILCRQDLVVVDQDHAPQDQHLAVSIEPDWACIKVQGPLEFSMTGILASLARPLATAGISIFAISTFDTDYLLVKQDQLGSAVGILRTEGHDVRVESEIEPISHDASAPSSLSSGKPHDGPAVQFEADPLLAHIAKKEESSSSRRGDDCDDLFGVYMVTLWPPNRHQFLEPYSRFRAAVELCFDETDLEPQPSVYFNPFWTWHITIATLFPFGGPDLNFNRWSDDEPVFKPRKNDDDVNKDATTQFWKQLVERASQNPLWPKSNAPLELTIDSAQIGQRAGILLWKESTGGLQAMRQCLQIAVGEEEAASKDLHRDVSSNASLIEGFSVAPIIHTTFLRFNRVPDTPGAVVQERFQANVLPRLLEFFPRHLVLSSASLICEDKPFLHVRPDKNHVIYSARFG